MAAEKLDKYSAAAGEECERFTSIKESAAAAIFWQLREATDSEAFWILENRFPSHLPKMARGCLIVQSDGLQAGLSRSEMSFVLAIHPNVSHGRSLPNYR